MGLKLADHKIVAQVHEVDLLALAVQRQPGQPGNGLRRHRLLAALGDHHMGVPEGTADVPLPEAGFRGGFQRDRAVRELNGLALKVHLIPAEFCDLAPAQTLQPGQTENGPLRAVGVPLQNAQHGGLVRPIERVSHGKASHLSPQKQRRGGTIVCRGDGRTK